MRTTELSTSVVCYRCNRPMLVGGDPDDIIERFNASDAIESNLHCPHCQYTIYHPTDRAQGK